MIFTIALIAVAVLLLTAVPGYLLVKRKMVSEDCIVGFSKVLLFVTQPCLAIYTFKSTEFSLEKLAQIGIFALLALGIHAVMLLGSFLVLRKGYKKAIYRIMTISNTFGNCAFFGIPIIEALLPESASDLIIYTTVYAVVMNLLGWTVASAIISQDTKHISLKKIIFNPTTLGAIAALTLFVLEIPIQKDLFSMLTTTARMATPLSMLIMGMRLGTMKLGAMFTNIKVYITVAVKQILMPLIAFAAILFLPVSSEVKCTFFIICACPAASVVLNFAELVGEGQKEAANIVLFGTILSILTLPVIMLLLPYLS